MHFSLMRCANLSRLTLSFAHRVCRDAAVTTRGENLPYRFTSEGSGTNEGVAQQARTWFSPTHPAAGPTASGCETRRSPSRPSTALPALSAPRQMRSLQAERSPLSRRRLTSHRPPSTDTQHRKGALRVNKKKQTDESAASAADSSSPSVSRCRRFRFPSMRPALASFTFCLIFSRVFSFSYASSFSFAISSFFL